MIAASSPVQRPVGAKLLVLDAGERLTHLARADFPAVLRDGDLVVANDAATLPSSLYGALRGEAIEVRLAGRGSLAPGDMQRFLAVVFGAGDYRTPTEFRAPPPALAAGDRISFGALEAEIVGTCGHARLVVLRFEGAPDAVRETLARQGRPIQYAHVPVPLELWDVWTPLAGPPVAFEPPSAGFLLNWAMLQAFADRGVNFATLTHAAGISSTGDPALDACLPFDEPYRIPESTAALIAATRRTGGRVVAVGTTVVRALEDSARRDGRSHHGNGIARGRISARTPLRVVDALVSGTHEPGSSHFELLRAFVGKAALDRMQQALETNGYRTHEFGDSIFIERGKRLGRSVEPERYLPAEPIAGCDCPPAFAG